MKKVLFAAVAAATLITSSAFAQDKKGSMDSGAAAGAVSGGAAGAVGGALVGGPVGAVVGGAMGAAVGATSGAVVGAIAADDRVYVRDYVVKQRVPATRVEGDVVVGATLPRTVQVYEIEGNPRLSSYRYAHVNGEYVLVDPSMRVVTVIN